MGKTQMKSMDPKYAKNSPNIEHKHETLTVLENNLIVQWKV
jgi:hypothetical protein